MNCEDPNFPLKRRVRKVRGRDYAEWVIKIKKKRVAFGACVNDPTGELAYDLYESERTAWQRCENPRTGGPRLSIARSIGRAAPAWLLAGPLAKCGVGIIDPAIGRLICLSCHSVWRVKFSDPSNIPARQLQCPRKCANPSTDEVRHTLRVIAGERDLIAAEYERLARERRDGWQSAPQDIDSQAESEGRALKMFIAKFAIKKPRRHRASTSRRIERLGTDR